jgi:hypothetical protein
LLQFEFEGSLVSTRFVQELLVDPADRKNHGRSGFGDIQDIPDVQFQQAEVEPEYIELIVEVILGHRVLVFLEILDVIESREAEVSEVVDFLQFGSEAFVSLGWSEVLA